jgi:hypothetical protein
MLRIFFRASVVYTLIRTKDNTSSGHWISQALRRFVREALIQMREAGNPSRPSPVSRAKRVRFRFGATFPAIDIDQGARGSLVSPALRREDLDWIPARDATATREPQKRERRGN